MRSRKRSCSAVRSRRRGQPFDLATRTADPRSLLRLAEEEHVLLVTMHHIVSDGWSMGVLMRELGALYGAYRAGRSGSAGAAAGAVRGLCGVAAGWLAGEVLEQQAQYWRTTLAGAPALLELPTDHARPAQQDYAGAQTWSGAGCSS